MYEYQLDKKVVTTVDDDDDDGEGREGKKIWKSDFNFPL